MFGLLVLILLVTLFVWDYLVKDQRKVRLAKQFKGPLALPGIGNLYMYLNKKPEGEQVEKLNRTYTGPKSSVI